jgi:hypothetical protein
MVGKMNRKKREKIWRWIIVIVLIMLVSFAIYKQSTKVGVFLGPSSDILRSFDMDDPYVGEEVTVTLDVVVDPVDQVYSIEEVVPAGVTIVSEGDGSLPGGNRIRWLEQPPLDSQKTYTVSFDSPGTYVFDGTYIFNDETPIETVSGETSVTVTSCTPSAEECDGTDNDCNHLVDDGGVCISCNTDVECGTDGLVGSSVCQTNDIYRYFRTYTCANPGTVSSACSSSDVAQIQTDCEGVTPYCDDSVTPTCVECVDTLNCGFNGQCQTNTCSCVVDYLEDTGANCCVGSVEIVTYIDNWLDGVGPTDQEQVTVAVNNWVIGVSACPA